MPPFMLCRRLYSHIGHIGQKFRYKSRVLPRCSAREFHVVLRAALAASAALPPPTKPAEGVAKSSSDTVSG